MTRPRLFMHVQDQELANQLMQSAVVRQFVLSRSSDAMPWSEQLLQQSGDLAFIQADKHSKADYQRLIDSRLLAEIDFIVVSDGNPDPMLDQLMRCGAGYHFRQPLDMASIF